MTPTGSPDERAADRLGDLATSFWEAVLEANPTYATTIGDRRFDDRLEDVSTAGRAASLELFRGHHRAAEAIDAEPLDVADRITRSALLDETAGMIAGLETGIDDWTVDPLNGPQVQLTDLPDFQPIRTPAEGFALAARWRAVGRHLDDHIDNLRRGLAAGRVAVRAPVERTIDEVRSLVARPVDELSFTRPARDDHPTWPTAELDRFRTEVREAVATVVRPAFARYLVCLETEILPVARPDERPGIGHLPGGDDAYRRFIRHHTSLDLGPGEVHELGLREIDRIDAEFEELGGRILGTRGLAETLSRLRDDPGLRFATAEEVFATAGTALARAQAATPGWFGRLPRAPCEVVAIPQHAEAHQTIAYYSEPAADGSRPGRYYINLYEPSTRPRFEAETLAFHESVPGHHLQIALAHELEGRPAFRRFLGTTAFVEGWGLYTERLADQMGLYSGDLDRFGMLSYDAWRACRLVVDTGMHAFGWSRDRAIGYMVEHTALGRNNIANEVDRYIVWPGQALAYKVGQLEIVRLRTGAEQKLGPRFDIRAFHDAVLAEGAVGLETLRGLVATWVASRT